MIGYWGEYSEILQLRREKQVTHGIWGLGDRVDPSPGGEIGVGNAGPPRVSPYYDMLSTSCPTIRYWVGGN